MVVVLGIEVNNTFPKKLTIRPCKSMVGSNDVSFWGPAYFYWRWLLVSGRVYMDTYHFPPMNAASLPPARDLGESDRSQHHPVADLVHQLRHKATSIKENKGSLTTKCLFN